MAKTPSIERKQKIMELIEEVGLWNVRPAHLAPQFGVTRQQIEKDIKLVLKLMPPENIDDIKFNLMKAYKKATKEMHKILASGNTSEKTKASQALSHLGKSYTDILEAYGIKEKIADKVEHTGEITILKNLIEKAKQEMDNE